MRHRQLLTAVLAVFTVVLTACQSGASPNSTSTTIVKGGTAKFAMPPNTTPNYIFLMEPPQLNSNIWGQFVELMWMQFYFFIDSDGIPSVASSRSIANQPSFWSAGKFATGSLKSWNWPGGQPITSRDVEF